jgi:lysozyme
MTTPLLLDDLRRDEGLRLSAYRDTRGVWTIGYGHTGAKIGPGLTWTQAMADAALQADVEHTEAGLDFAVPWWRSLNDVRQDVLCEMAFNLGVYGLLKFQKMLTAVRQGAFGTGAAQMLMSDWAEQVGDRAMRLSILMEHGVR